MVRKLPWSIVPAPETSPSPRRVVPRPQKRERVAEADATESREHPLTEPSTPKTKRLKDDVSSRPASSSPVPSPPSEHSMNPGFEADDIYVMVEDEFQAVAQQFTAHLHRAEYKRMQREARAAAAAKQNDITYLNEAKAILRPTDGKTVMSAELKKVKQAREMARKTARGVKELVGDSDEDRPTYSSEEEANEVDKVLAAAEEEEEDDDIGIGTSLHGLMASPKKSHPSLLGLEGVRSSTRAAAGFKKQVAPSGGLRSGVTADGWQVRGATKGQNEDTDEEVTSGLDAEAHHRSPNIAHASRPNRQPPPSPTPTPSCAKTSNPIQPTPRRRQIFDDGFEDETSYGVPPAVSKSLASKKTKKALETRSKGDRDDIPLFLG